MSILTCLFAAVALALGAAALGMFVLLVKSWQESGHVIYQWEFFKQEYTGKLKKIYARLDRLQRADDLLGLPRDGNWEEFARLRALLHSGCDHVDPMEQYIVRDTQATLSEKE